jgi:DNA-binding MarR family transcriptional regulator
MSHIMYEQLRRLSYALEPLEISGPTWRLLSELHFNGPASIRDLARLAALERSNVSRLVDKMKQDGLVVSCASQDRRVHIVDLSDAGRAKYDAAAVLVAPLNMATVSIFTPDELDRLTGMLKRLSMVLGVDFERPATGPDNQHK